MLTLPDFFLPQSEDFAGRTWRANQSYLELMCRCLQEVVRLDHDGRAQSNEPE